MSKLDLIATATFGLESVVADEVKKLGYEDVRVENGRVEFTGDELAICRSNLWLRVADRVRLKVGEFTATTFEELFEKTKALPWADFLPMNAEFPVEGKSIKSTLFSVSDCQAIVKKAVVESMKKKYKLDWFPEDGPLFKIEVALLKDVATLTIDTSGPGLHKRGYRTLVSQAPLKETLAAALLQLAKWYPDVALIDPFCGSGTIPIEAALMGRNIAPGLNRDFACSNWPWISESTWKKARQEAHDSIRAEKTEYIMGTDIDERVLRVARRNAEQAGVSEDIHFQSMAVTEISSKKKYGKIICNPPYGERISERDEVAKLYKEMAKTFKTFDTWSYYILTSHPAFEKLFGKPASKRRKLYNGNIEVQYYQYFGPRPPRINRINSED